MLKNKLYACNNCGYGVPILSKGLCPGCRQKQKTDSLNQKPIKRSNIRRTFPKKTSKKLKSFFDTQLELLVKEPYSQESGQYIANPSKLNLAHFLPKKPNGGFPSISDDFDNCIFLTWPEHSRFDQLQEQRKFDILEKEYPNTWNLEKLSLLLSKCTERNKFYFQLTEYLKNSL